MDIEPEEPRLEPDRSFMSPAVRGIVIPNLLAAAAMAAIMLAGMSSGDAAATIGVTAFIAIPLVMGFISAYYWRDLGWNAWMYVGYSAINFMIVLVLATIVAREGIICLLIMMPLVFVELLVGVFIGKLVYRRRSPPLSSSVVAVLLLFFLFYLTSKHDYRAEVSDRIVIDATPDRVWRYVDATPRNDAPPEFWLFSIGMPRPVQTTVEAHRQGAGRACVFSSGVTFDEVMSIYEPGRNLTFDIVKQPADPEIIGHITMERGQFLLRDNGDGTTTLTGTSWYRLHVFPAWYFDLWAEAITRNVHLHAMKHIKRLAEESRVADR
jgi:hypothetical protein